MNRFNSTFKAKQSSLKRTAWIKKRRTEETARKARRVYLKAGPRMKAWNSAWRFLKREFEKREITRCEFDFIPHECWGALYPCHSKKRRLMQGDDIYAVAIGCQQIARILDEELDHASMFTAVMRAIEAREVA